MSLTIAPLFSGSSGNSILLRSKNARVLIDAGVSCKKICEELEKTGTDIRGIDGILITHEHSDHIKGLDVISRKFGVPIYANENTWDAIMPSLKDIDKKNVRIITTDDFYIKDINIKPFSISHDAADPFGYTLCSGGKYISTLTDLGKVTKEVLENVKRSSIVLLEANHDENMLIAGSYPYMLKKRILSGKGHLSNEAAAKAALYLAINGVKGILLGHLSQNNNIPDIALSAVTGFLAKNGIEAGRHVAVAVARRDGLTGIYDAI